MNVKQQKLDFFSAPETIRLTTEGDLSFFALQDEVRLFDLLYIFGHKTFFSPSKTILKNLDQSVEMDLDFWDCFRREKPSS